MRGTSRPRSRVSEFAELLARARAVEVMPPAPTRDAGYEAQGRWVADHCDVLARRVGRRTVARAGRHGRDRRLRRRPRHAHPLGPRHATVGGTMATRLHQLRLGRQVDGGGRVPSARGRRHPLLDRAPRRGRRHALRTRPSSTPSARRGSSCSSSRRPPTLPCRSSARSTGPWPAVFPSSRCASRTWNPRSRSSTTSPGSTGWTRSPIRRRDTPSGLSRPCRR